MGIAFIYPGQGSQYVGMGKDLCDLYPEIKEIFQKADKIVGFELSVICFEGPEIELKQTFVTQPAIFVHSMAITKIVEKKVQASFSAGHSLGEYCALVYAGALTFEDGLKLVKIRGEQMQRAGELNKGTMAAIIGLDTGKVREVCKEASSAGIVQVANINSPGQVVISGSVEGVKKAMELAKANKARLVKELFVHGAFHSPLMEPAGEELKKALNATEFKQVRIPVYRNVDAKPIMPQTPPGEIRDSLYRQLTSSVQWEESIINMINDGADEFIELGPGKILQGLVKRINSSVAIKGFEKVSDLELL
jgi:[acyl-carrier-protein] S-malonyltransferase